MLIKLIITFQNICQKKNNAFVAGLIRTLTPEDYLCSKKGAINPNNEETNMEVYILNKPQFYFVKMICDF